MKTEIKTETDNYDWVLGQGDSVFINEDGFFAEDDPYAHETQQIAYIDDTLQERFEKKNDFLEFDFKNRWKDVMLEPSVPSATTYDPATSAEQVDASSTENSSMVPMG